jgi:hypothetical protein
MAAADNVGKLATDVNSLSLAISQQALPEAESSPLIQRHGNLWSQYHTLDPTAIAPLEEAILFCRVRAYDQSNAILDAFPPELRQHPVVAFERSQNSWLGWKLKDCLNVLREAIAWAEAHGKVEDASGMYTLLRMSLARAEVLVDADFSKARESLREIKRWLENSPVDEYTDVQVSYTVTTRRKSLRLTNA